MSPSPKSKFVPKSSKVLFKITDKVFAKKGNGLPMPGMIYDIISDVQSQPMYKVYLYKTGKRFKCLSKNLFPYKKNKSEFEKNENDFGTSVLNKDDNRACLMPGKINNQKQEEFKNIGVVKPNKYFSYESYIPIPSTKLLTAMNFRNKYSIFNDLFSKKPIILLNKFDYIKPLTRKQNNKTADEIIDPNETNSNIIDKRTKTFKITEFALDSSNVSSNNNNEITSSSNKNILCVTRFGRIINKPILFNQQNITDEAKKRYKNKQISDHVLRLNRKRLMNINSNQQKITDATKASKDVTKVDNSLDIGAASRSRDKSESEISQLIHATSNTKIKSEINNLGKMVEENNIAFLEAAVEMLSYLKELHKSLNISKTDYITALNMLVLIYETPINMPMMIQYPIIFATFQKLSNYVGVSTNLNDFKQIVQIKQLSTIIFIKKIQSLFVVPEGATVEGVFYKAVMDNLGREV